jgi:hypothetical protein
MNASHQGISVHPPLLSLVDAPNDSHNQMTSVLRPLGYKYMPSKSPPSSPHSTSVVLWLGCVIPPIIVVCLKQYLLA